MNIKSKYKKQILAMLVVTLVSVSFVGCNKTTDDKIAEGQETTQLASTESSEEVLSEEEASRILYDTLVDSKLWWTFTEEWEDYYIFEETSVGADFRYLVNKYTGEVYYESAADIGNLINYNEVDDSLLNVGPKPMQIVSELTPKLKKLESLKEAKKKISNDFQNMLKKHNFEITDVDTNNNIVVSDTTYNKYTVDYKQFLYYAYRDDFSKGTGRLKFGLSKMMHDQDAFNKDDDFIKLMYDMYIYLTKSQISNDEFNKILQATYEAGGNANELTDKYLGITITREKNELKMEARVDFEGILKSKYYKAEYDTVAEYKEKSEQSKKNLKSLTEKYSGRRSIGIIDEGGVHGFDILSINYNYGKTQFMHTGKIHLCPEGADGLFTESEVSTLLDSIRLAVGDSVFEKMDKSYLTVDNLNMLIKAQKLQSKYEDLFEYGEYYVPVYLDNANVGMYYSGIIIDFSVPVIAEGIRSL